MLDEVFEDIETENIQSQKEKEDDVGLLDEFTSTVSDHVRDISTTISNLIPNLFSKSSSEDNGTSNTSTKSSDSRSVKKMKESKSLPSTQMPRASKSLQLSVTRDIESSVEAQANLAFISMSLPDPNTPGGPLKLQSIPSNDDNDDAFTVFSNDTALTAVSDADTAAVSDEYETQTMIEHKSVGSPGLTGLRGLGLSVTDRSQMSSSTNGSFLGNDPPMSPIVVHGYQYSGSQQYPATPPMSTVMSSGLSTGLSLEATSPRTHGNVHGHDPIGTDRHRESLVATSPTRVNQQFGHFHYGMPQMNHMQSTQGHAATSPRTSYHLGAGLSSGLSTGLPSGGMGALARSKSLSLINVSRDHNGHNGVTAQHGHDDDVSQHSGHSGISNHNAHSQHTGHTVPGHSVPGHSVTSPLRRSVPPPLPTTRSVSTLSLDSFYPIPANQVGYSSHAATYHNYKSTRRSSPMASGPLPQLPDKYDIGRTGSSANGIGSHGSSPGLGSPRGLAMPLPRLQNRHSGPSTSVQVPHIIDADHIAHHGPHGGMPRLRRAASHESVESSMSTHSTQSRSSAVTSKSGQSTSMHSLRSTQSVGRSFPAPIAVNNSTYLRSIRSQPMLPGLANEGYSTPNSSMGTIGLPSIAEDPVCFHLF